ncbi:KIR-like protein [Plasmodium coatneyi]|uniref:KIR-like protein n=1 Tax=Plasmodium coatneyi TaxID=208452 RepID=A0A1B1E1Z6_9APIC|nr:KIR-like protein [Plasmodium coatneyi]ANQ08965.1 KIR-like protein [Plasmodium coatneyi]
MAEKTCKQWSITDKLTSYNDFYTNFGNDGGGRPGGMDTEGTQLKGEIQTTCPNCTEIIKDVKKIDHAYDYACLQGRTTGFKSDSASCRLFYYWFGHNYWSHLKGTKLSSLLEKIYTKLEETSSCNSEKKCDFKYNDLEDQAIFKDMKIIFEYYNDYKQVQSELSKSGTTCAEKWSNYWETISSACEKMNDKCKEDGGADKEKQYCNDFNNTYAVHCDTANLHQEMEVLIKKMQREADEAQITATKAKDEAVRSAFTTSSLSSIFGTLGMTVAPFILYKYKPWYSWFGNHSGNGGGRRSTRKKGSTGQNFDVSAEDTFTEYSTDNSTIGDSAGESSTVRSSSAYTTPSTRPSTGGRERRANNTRAGRGMVGYQNM